MVMKRLISYLGVPYTPQPDQRPFLERLKTVEDTGVEIKLAALSKRESEHFFGVPLGRRGIQPVWLEVTNLGHGPLFFDRVFLDPNYYPPLEAAMVNHFSLGRRIARIGALAWFFLPLLVFLPIKLWAARRANRRMNDFFDDHAFPIGAIAPETTAKGFVFTLLDDGTKIAHLRVLT